MQRAEVLVRAWRVEAMRELLTGVENWRLELLLRADDRMRNVVAIRPRDRRTNRDRCRRGREAEVVDRDAVCVCGRYFGFERDVRNCDRMIDIVKRDPGEAEHFSQSIVG